MKFTTLAIAAALMVGGGSAMAQTNATVQGTQTAPSNSAGTPNATSNTGTLGGAATAAPATTPPPGNVAAGQPTSTTK